MKHLTLLKLRPPFIHMQTANEGGMPLRQAIASFFFVSLHDHVSHTCLIPEVVDSAEEEWAYLRPRDASRFLIIAQAAIEQVQRWIAEGSEDPFEIQHLGGPIVQRPQWAVEYFGNPDSPRRKEARELVQKLLEEIENTE
jgi:hypothetical protein